MNIFRKVFLSFLGLTAITLLITLGLARWSFDQGFLDFVAGLEQQRLGELSVTLSAVYSRDKTWDAVIKSGLEHYASTPAMHIKGRPPALHQPSPLRHPGKDLDSPGNRAGPPHPRLNRQDAAPPTALFDPQDKWLVGAKPRSDANDMVSFSIYLQGEKVGELRSWLDSVPQSELASSFSTQQRYASIAIGLLCLLLAGIASWLLATKLTSPVKQVIHGVERLSLGHYDLSLNPTRADELGILMRNLNGLSHILSENRSAKNRWFADISHELRTPLTILLGELDALEAGIRPFGPKQIESLQQEALLLHRLVDDLYQLSLSDVGGLKYHFNQIDISKICHNVCSALASKAQQKGLQLTTQIQDKVTCLADPQRIEQLFINLLNNAILYTQQGGEIQVSLSQNAHSAVFEINDTLPSVPEEDCDKLFDPLYRQSTSRNRSAAGAGLGLTICKNIVIAHKGSITASPSTLGGLCARVELRLTKNKI